MKSIERYAAVLMAIAITVPSGAHAAVPQARTLRAWHAYVAAVEARIVRELGSLHSFLVSDAAPDAAQTRARIRRGERVIARMAPPPGAALDVAGGQIAHWRGSLLVPGVALDDLLHLVQHPPEAGPHQDDVVGRRVLQRVQDQLHLAIRMRRTGVVTVTYDTEHRIEYTRHGAGRASSRSVATKIAELDGAGTPAEREKGPGEDRGFLWRLQSYWRYQQVDEGVIVELESLTLSRSVPLGLSLVVQPIIDDIARESIHRTLDHLRRTYGQKRQHRG